MGLPCIVSGTCVSAVHTSTFLGVPAKFTAVKFTTANLTWHEIPPSLYGAPWWSGTVKENWCTSTPHKTTTPSSFARVLYTRLGDAGVNSQGNEGMLTNPPPPIPPWPNTGLSKHGDPAFPHFWTFLGTIVLRFRSSRECGLQLCAGCRKGTYGCQSVGVAVIPCALVFWGVCWHVALYCHILRGTSATCLPWYMPRGDMGLSKHSDAVFLHFCPLNQQRSRRVSGGYL